MLYLFRKSQRWLLWLLLIVVVVTFVFWGTKVPSIFRVSPTAKISSYDGAKITNADLQEARNGARILMALQRIPANTVDQGTLTTQAVHYLVQSRKAKKAGATVGDDIIKAYASMLAPVGAGPEAYKNYIQANYGIANPREFEEHLRNIFSAVNAERDLSMTFFAPENEKLLDYAAANVKATIQYVSFAKTGFAAKAAEGVSSNDVQALFEESPAEFARPAKYRFLVANFKADTNQVQFAEQELQDYFDLYQGDFTTTNEFGETVDQEFAAARPQVLEAFLKERAQELATDKALEFQDFLKIEEKASEEDLVKEFQDAAKQFGVQVQDSNVHPVGEIPYTVSSSAALAKLVWDEPAGTLDVFEASDSLHQVYLQVLRSEAFEPDFEEAEADVRDACVQKKSLEMAEAAAQEFLEKAKAEGADFKALAEAQDLKVTETQPQTPAASVTMDIPTDESRALFAAPAGQPMLLKGRNGSYVAVVKEFVEVDPSFADKSVSDRLAQQRTAMESALFSLQNDQEVERILAEIQGNLKKEEASYGE